MEDPGFSVVGLHPLGGRGPLTWALFGENVCENKRIGSHRGRAQGTPPLDPPMHNKCLYELVQTEQIHVKVKLLLGPSYIYI